MVSAHPATSLVLSLAASATASASALAAASIIAHNKDQKGGAVSGHASRRLSHLCFQIGGFSSSPRRRPAPINLPLSVGQALPVRAIRGCARIFIDAFRLPAARVQSLSDQQLSKSFADLGHLSKRLSSSARLVGFEANANEVTYWANSLCIRSKKN